MERAQIPIYLHLQRPDLASAVYADILGGDPDDASLFAILHDPDPAIRTGAVRVLGLAGRPKAIGELARAAKDSDQDVRRAAVAALGTIKDPKTVPPLLDALKDSYWFARSDAADALGREHDPRAIEPLFGLIGDPDKTVQSSAENALILLASTKGGSGRSLRGPAERFEPEDGGSRGGLSRGAEGPAGHAGAPEAGRLAGRRRAAARGEGAGRGRRPLGDPDPAAIAPGSGDQRAGMDPSSAWASLTISPRCPPCGPSRPTRRNRRTSARPPARRWIISPAPRRRRLLLRGPEKWIRKGF